MCKQGNGLLAVVFKQAFACQCFELGTCLAVIGKGMNGDAAARCEFAENFDVFRIHQCDQVFHDDVDTVFMEIAVVAEAEEVEFQGLAFHHLDVRDVADVDGGKVGLPGHGAETGEFRTDEFDEIVVVGMFVVECFENFGSVSGRILGLLIAQKRDALQLFSVAGHEGFLSFLMWEVFEPRRADCNIRQG